MNSTTDMSAVVPKNKNDVKKEMLMKQSLDKYNNTLLSVVSVLEKEKSREKDRKEAYKNAKNLFGGMLRKDLTNEKLKKWLEDLEIRNSSDSIIYAENVKTLTAVKKDCSREIEKIEKKLNGDTKKKAGDQSKTQQKIPQSLRDAFGITQEFMTRPQFTIFLYKYAKDNNLKDIKNGQILRVDDVIQKGLQITDAERKHMNETTNPRDEKGLIFFNVQKKLAELYKKADETKTNV